MNNKKFLAILLLAAVAATGTWLNSSFADELNTDKTEDIKQEFRMKWKWFWLESFEGRNKKWQKLNLLTDEEKIAFESMTDAEKKDFLETKKTEKHTLKLARENVIDKLLAWEQLTEEEEIIRAEIIENRAVKKAEMETKKAERDELKEIFEKRKAWEDLTEYEQAKIDDMKAHFKNNFKKR